MRKHTANHGGTFFYSVFSMQIKELQTPLTYSEQIACLRDKHGLTIENEEWAASVLSSVNYYRLSAYGIGLIDKATDRYPAGTSFNMLYSLYRFDSKLRNLLIAIIEYIEIEFRTKIAYTLAINYGAEGYRDADNFNDKISSYHNIKLHSLFCDRLENEINKQSRRPLVKHHLENYDGRFPIWVAVEIISFGTLSTLYSAMVDSDQRTVSKSYNTNPDYMRSWFAAFVELRNTCAHYGRIYNTPFSSTPKLPKEYIKHKSNKLFPHILAICYVLKGNSVLRDFLTTLKALLGEFDMVNLSFLGFPKNWERIVDEVSRPTGIIM